MAKNNESEKYQKMLGEVETVLKQVANPEVDLDTLVEKVEHGYQLIKEMKNRLEETKKKIEVLRNEFDGSNSLNN